VTVTLTPELERLVREKIERGEYESAEALVGQAVLLLLEEETAQDEIRLRIEAAEGEIDSGQFVEYETGTIHELARSVHERGLKKLAGERDRTPG
jgi:Arc/MetJ-type ribon-helix-helix transcriptional regulator